MVRRSGRRPGNQDTRQSILEAARKTFAERGFDKASIRAIASAAGVDPALVHHYFGTKDKLFLACLDAPIDPGALVPLALEGPVDQVGERIVRLVLGIWESPAGTAALAILRSAMSNDWTARLIREFVVTQILRRVVAGLNLDPAEAPMRTALVASQLAGLAMTRHVLKLEPLASTPAESLAALVGPTIQRYLTAPLPSVVADPVTPRSSAGRAPDA